MLRMAKEVLTTNKILLLISNEHKSLRVIGSFEINEAEAFVIDYIYHNYDSQIDNQFFIRAPELLKVYHEQFITKQEFNSNIINNILYKLSLKNLIAIKGNQLYPISLFPLLYQDLNSEGNVDKIEIHFHRYVLELLDDYYHKHTS